jgi:hypothetical protein
MRITVILKDDGPAESGSGELIVSSAGLFT